MIAVKEPAMNPQDFAAVVEVNQMTIPRLTHKGDLPGTCGSSRSRTQGSDMQSWIQAQMQGNRLLHLVLKGLV